MLQNSIVAGIDLTSPRRSTGQIFRDQCKVNFLLKTPQNAGNSLSELQEIQNFLWRGMPPDPSRGSHLLLLTRLPQNPSYSLICCPMMYTYQLNHAYIYMLVATLIQADTDLPNGTSPGSPVNTSFKVGPEPTLIPHTNISY